MGKTMEGVLPFKAVSKGNGVYDIMMNPSVKKGHKEDKNKSDNLDYDKTVSKDAELLRTAGKNTTINVKTRAEAGALLNESVY